MRLVAERIAATEELARQLDTRKPTQEDLRAVRELMKEEIESRDKSTRIASTDSYNEQYRRNMRQAVANSNKVLDLLQQAYEHIKSRNNKSASVLLMQIVEARGKKAATPRAHPLGKLYEQYLIETDEEFHAWLRKNGHTEALKQVAS